jgi:hypothetical protein
MAKQTTKNDRIAKIARRVLKQNTTASTGMIADRVNQELRNGAAIAKISYILKARAEFRQVKTRPSIWTLNQSIDADDSLGVE